MIDVHGVASVAIMSGITLLLRMFPFLVFREGKVPRFVEYLGKYLPFAIIGMLVVYCLKDVSFVAHPFGIPEIVSVALVAGLHVWRRNTLLSIVSGTVFYMLITTFLV